jgi:hypothetical protein
VSSTHPEIRLAAAAEAMEEVKAEVTDAQVEFKIEANNNSDELPQVQSIRPSDLDLKPHHIDIKFVNFRINSN